MKEATKKEVWEAIPCIIHWDIKNLTTRHPRVLHLNIRTLLVFRQRNDGMTHHLIAGGGIEGVFHAATFDPNPWDLVGHFAWPSPHCGLSPKGTILEWKAPSKKVVNSNTNGKSLEISTSNHNLKHIFSVFTPLTWNMEPQEMEDVPKRHLLFSQWETPHIQVTSCVVWTEALKCGITVFNSPGVSEAQGEQFKHQLHWP